MKHILKTPVVRLRAMEPEDLDTLYKIENDTSLWNVGTTNVPYSRFALHEYIANASGDIYVDRQVRQMVENDKGHIVGIVDIFNFDPSHRRAEVGIVIQQLYRGMGYGVAALESVTAYASTILHLHQLYAYVDKENESSVALFRAVAYQCVAELPHWLFNGEKYCDVFLFQKILQKSGI